MSSWTSLNPPDLTTKADTRSETLAEGWNFGINPPDHKPKDDTVSGTLAEERNFDTTLSTFSTEPEFRKDLEQPSTDKWKFETTVPTFTNAARSARKDLDQPPLFLFVTRTGPTTVQLAHALTNEVFYRIHDTGRGAFSSKPDFEIFRPQSGNLLVGSVRYGKRKIEANLSLTEVKVDDVEKYNSTATSLNLRWRTNFIGRKRSGSKPSPESPRNSTVPHWIAELDCFPSDMSTDVEDNKIAAVKLFDGLPTGRIEIWDKNACVDIGGDWNVLDELVTVAYANMEKARRRVMMGPNPGSMGFGTMAFGLGGIGFG